MMCFGAAELPEPFPSQIRSHWSLLEVCLPVITLELLWPMDKPVNTTDSRNGNIKQARHCRAKCQVANFFNGFAKHVFSSKLYNINAIAMRKKLAQKQ
mmetsp:Transcript_41736/g.61352  ORF Transcript_41736/g.61352 Transcript_41736/m.61352 type:complete len:98 (+) Transcript_41736:2922-3215(+)